VPPLLAGWRGAVKRGIDIAVALVAVVLCAPLLLVVAIAIKLDSPGPVLFRQRRIGLNNQPFELLKFRTMQHRPPDRGRLRQTCPRDPRVTRVGALLRQTSLDELPQVWNVLRGEMSLVGPRPHAPGTCAGATPFEQVTERYDRRHQVRPGITGLAQVRGWRGQTDTEEKLLRRLDSDLEYIATWSLWLDCVILARTVATVLRMRNAY
jgi:exopolysaccharide biosynthesis polyprenyl glycosylphosphotransferase